MLIIAESAFNHNKNLEYLKELADASIKNGADFFTVQVMDVASFCTKEYSKHDLYIQNSFTRNEWLEFFSYCSENEIKLIPCALEQTSFELCYDYGFRFFKIHATDITNVPFLENIKSKRDCSIILETQCATYQDIKFGLDIIGNFVKVIFHGYSNYPTEFEDTNLRAIESLKRDFPNFDYGIADHSPTIDKIATLAMGLGYTYIEKHVTLTRNNRNFDWQVSILPEELAILSNQVKLNKIILGGNVKHPVANELNYRNILYKKYIDGKYLRDDEGQDYLDLKFSSFAQDRIGIALIARLKSERLKKKVLKSFIDRTIIEDLFKSLSRSKMATVVNLATSYLTEDAELIELIGMNNSFAGHPISVIDRLLSFAIKHELGGIIRVTGDNPFTPPELIDEMINLYLDNNLDYVRINNVPFGMSPEFFSTKYLWKLYLKMDNPLNSEYLSWFVLNDNTARKGCINFIPKNPEVSLVNLSIDYEEDYQRSIDLIKRMNLQSVTELNFNDVIINLDLKDIIDSNKQIKLPENKSIKLKNYLKQIDQTEYIIKLDKYEK